MHYFLGHSVYCANRSNNILLTANPVALWCRGKCVNMGSLSSKLPSIQIFRIFPLGFVAVVGVFIGINNWLVRFVLEYTKNYSWFKSYAFVSILGTSATNMGILCRRRAYLIWAVVPIKCSSVGSLLCGYMSQCSCSQYFFHLPYCAKWLILQPIMRIFIYHKMVAM